MKRTSKLVFLVLGTVMIFASIANAGFFSPTNTTTFTKAGGITDFGGYALTDGGTLTGTNLVATSTTATSTFSYGATFATSGGTVGIGTTTPFLGVLDLDAGSNLTAVYLTGSVNNYQEFQNQNRNSGTLASTDFVTSNNLS